MIYFSPSAADGRGAFFDDAIFGAREIEVIDEKRQTAALTRAIAADLEEYRLAVAAAEADGQPGPHRLAYQRRQRLAEDNPIRKTIANPDCRLPADAVEVSADDYAELMARQSEGMEIVPATSGRPIAVARGSSPDQIIATVRSLRDRALAASDWTQLPDAAAALSEAKRQAWTEHRQKLRDLPAEVAAAFAKHVPVGIVDPVQLLPRPPE